MWLRNQIGQILLQVVTFRLALMSLIGRLIQVSLHLLRDGMSPMVLAYMVLLPHHQTLIFFLVPTFLRLFIGMILSLLQEEVRFCFTKTHTLCIFLCFNICASNSSLQIKLLSNYRLVLTLVTLNLTATSQTGDFSCLNRFILYILVMLEM